MDIRGNRNAISLSPSSRIEFGVLAWIGSISFSSFVPVDCAAGRLQFDCSTVGGQDMPATFLHQRHFIYSPPLLPAQCRRRWVVYFLILMLIG
jgi:hypothetical protein